MTTWPYWPRPPVWRTNRPWIFSHGRADRLAVGDLGPADVRVHRELAHEAVDDDLEVELAHAGDEGLAGLLVRPDAEGRVLLGEAREPLAELVLVGLRLRLDRDRDDRVRELHRLEPDRRGVDRERVAGRRGLEADGGDDLAGADLLALLAVVRVHLEQAADALGLARGDVHDPLAGLDLPGVDPEVGQLADVRIAHHLEGQRRERLVLGGAPGELVARARVDPVDRRDVERARQVVDDGVEQRLHALVLEGGAEEDGRDRDRERRLAERAPDHVRRDRALVGEVGLEQLLVVLGDRVDQLVVVLVGLLLELLGDLDGGDLRAEVVLPDGARHLDDVDDPAEVLLLADRQLHRDGMGPEAVDHRLHGGEEVRAGAVHLVDEGDARDAVAVGLAPDRLGLRLHACDGVEDGDRAVEDAQAALHLDRKVHVPGRIDDVDAKVAPDRRRGGRRDRDAALLLLRHPVHDGRALVDLAHLVGAARVVEDPLGRRRLAGVDVRHDPDVADLVETDLPACLHGAHRYHL